MLFLPIVAQSGERRIGVSAKILDAAQLSQNLTAWSFLRTASIPPRAMPSRATADPPSGTPAPVVSALNVKLAWRIPPADCALKAQVPEVGSNPAPVSVPVPVIISRWLF